MIARMVFQRVKNFIQYRIAASLQLLIFFFIAVFWFEPSKYYSRTSSPHEAVWPKFFSLPVLMLMLITLLNDGTLISIGYDYVNASQRPEKWNLKALWAISTVLGAVPLVSSLLLLWGALDSHNVDGMFAAFKLPRLEYGKICTLIYLKVGFMASLLRPRAVPAQLVGLGRQCQYPAPQYLFQTTPSCLFGAAPELCSVLLFLAACTAAPHTAIHCPHCLSLAGTSASVLHPPCKLEGHWHVLTAPTCLLPRRCRSQTF